MNKELTKTNKKNQAKAIIMPTAQILGQITYDGLLDNNAIKTSSIIKKQGVLGSFKLNKKKINQKIFDLHEPRNSEKDLVKFNNFENIENQEILLNEENLDTFLEEEILKIKTNFRDLQIKAVKDNSENNELQTLLLSLAKNNLSKDLNYSKLSINSQKIDENFLFQQIEKYCECECSSCIHLNNNYKSFYSPEIYFKKLSNDYEIESKKVNKEEFSINLEKQLDVKEKFVIDNKIENFLEENNVKEIVNIDDTTQKNFKKTYNIIYSQKVLNDILETKICSEIEEYEAILESLKRKKIFLKELENSKYGLNQINLKHLNRMKEKLLNSEKIFFENNKIGRF